jgi:hypothetical protein
MSTNRRKPMSETGPEEDITPRDTLPEEQLPEPKPAPGWQVEPLPVPEWTAKCYHMGRISAALQVDRYPLGAEWVCPCGQVFVAAINAGGKKTLMKKEDVVETPNEHPGEQLKGPPNV